MNHIETCDLVTNGEKGESKAHRDKPKSTPKDEMRRAMWESRQQRTQ